MIKRSEKYKESNKDINILSRGSCVKLVIYRNSNTRINIHMYKMYFKKFCNRHDICYLWKHHFILHFKIAYIVSLLYQICLYPHEIDRILSKYKQIRTRGIIKM